MNSFDFVGTITSCKIKTSVTNKKYLSITMNENYRSTANLQMYCDNLSYNGTIPVYFNSDDEKHYIKYEDRFDSETLLTVIMPVVRKTKSIITSWSNLSKN